MLRWPMLAAAATALATGLHPAAVRAQETDLVFAIPVQNSQKVSLDAKLLDPKDALTRCDDLFTDEFVK